jgi:predicted hydrocarbon binding protein
LLANYEFDEDNGIIRDKLTSERCLLVYEKGLESVFKGLSEIFKAGIEVLLLESSRASSRHIVDLAGKEAKKNIKHSLSVYAKRLAQVGFGRLEVVELKPEESRMRVRVWNNFFAEIRDDESTYCSYMAGLISGVYEGLLDLSPKVKEVKCIGKGDPYCEFLLTLKSGLKSLG